MPALTGYFGRRLARAVGYSGFVTDEDTHLSDAHASNDSVSAARSDALAHDSAAARRRATTHNHVLHKNPFMHMWSLGVEEQFYFVFPMLILVAYGRRAVAATPELRGGDQRRDPCSGSCPYVLLGGLCLLSFGACARDARLIPHARCTPPARPHWLHCFEAHPVLLVRAHPLWYGTRTSHTM
jgi:hypothetical protein